MVKRGKKEELKVFELLKKDKMDADRYPSITIIPYESIVVKWKGDIEDMSISKASVSQSSRIQLLNTYLTAVRDAGDINAHTASIAWIEWNLLSQSVGGLLPAPDAAPGPEGQLLYVWEKEEHYYEAEIFPDDAIEFFYWNRKTNETWGKDCKVNEPVSPDIKLRLEIFTL